MKKKLSESDGLNKAKRGGCTTPTVACGILSDSAPVNDYPANWPQIATRIKDAAGWKCERCKHPHEVETGYLLTVHHLDNNKANCADWNLAALCQRCHLKIQGRVKMDQLFFGELLPVSPWFVPHLAGYLASKRAALPCPATFPEALKDDALTDSRCNTNTQRLASGEKIRAEQ